MGSVSLEEMREMARAIFAEAVKAVDPYERLREVLRVDGAVLRVIDPEGDKKDFDLKGFERIFLIGTGKAAASMARAVEGILKDRLTRGLITTKYGHALPLEKIEVIESGHPVPDRNGLEGAGKMRELLRQSGPKDLILFVLSGGGSALLPFPSEGIRLEEKQEVTQLLLRCGADIQEMNTIRKHISRTKGGWLARSAYPSAVISLILSDVVGDPLDMIASGPTVPDPTTFEDAWAILVKYGLQNEVPSSIRNHLQAGREGRIEETPKPGDPAFERVHHVLIGSNIQALQAARRKAIAFGFKPLILSSSVVGETREAARFHAAIAREILASGNPVGKPACIISGGETTVTIKGNGLGGRNQEFALAAAIDIAGFREVVILSGGTDGTDGPTDAAGAIADGTTVERALRAGLDPKAHLENNDAYPFFQRLGDLLMTGPTQTNVMDVRIVLVD